MEKNSRKTALFFNIFLLLQIKKDLMRFFFISFSLFNKKKTLKKTTKQVFDLLVQHGFDVNEKGRNGNSALHYAAMTTNTQAVRSLQRHGASFNSFNHEHDTELHFGDVFFGFFFLDFFFGFFFLVFFFGVFFGFFFWFFFWFFF